MLLRVIAVKWQMPDDRVATFELRLQVRRPEEALHHRALVLTIRCEHDETATLQKLNERGPPWARVQVRVVYQDEIRRRHVGHGLVHLVVAV
jgi:hypothetical protein